MDKLNEDNKWKKMRPSSADAKGKEQKNNQNKQWARKINKVNDLHPFIVFVDEQMKEFKNIESDYFDKINKVLEDVEEEKKATEEKVKINDSEYLCLLQLINSYNLNMPNDEEISKSVDDKLKSANVDSAVAESISGVDESLKALIKSLIATEMAEKNEQINLLNKQIENLNFEQANFKLEQANFKLEQANFKLRIDYLETNNTLVFNYIRGLTPFFEKIKEHIKKTQAIYEYCLLTTKFKQSFKNYMDTLYARNVFLLIFKLLFETLNLINISRDDFIQSEAQFNKNIQVFNLNKKEDEKITIGFKTLKKMYHFIGKANTFAHFKEQFQNDQEEILKKIEELFDDENCFISSKISEVPLLITPLSKNLVQNLNLEITGLTSKKDEIEIFLERFNKNNETYV